MNAQLSEAGLARRLKRHFSKQTHRFYAMTTPGFEGSLRAELAQIPGCTIGEKSTGGLEFSGPPELALAACLHLRTANRVVMRVDEFTARSYPELYNKVKRLPWELYCGFATEVAVDATAASSRLHHTGNIADAVFEACRDHQQELGIHIAREEIAPLRFLVRFSQDRCTISIDAGGPLLYKRGYRQETAHAPIRESVAAALLITAGWQNFPVVADPLCGSGTIPIEAALLATGTPPGAHRAFPFRRWPSFKPGVWDRLSRVEAATPGRMPKILGSDISGSAITAAKGNAERAGMAGHLSLVQADCLGFNHDGSAGKNGLLIANLPYGKRAFASGSELREFGRTFGKRLRESCSGWHYGFVTADAEFAKIAGLPVRSKLKFVNGGIDVWFVQGKIG